MIRSVSRGKSGSWLKFWSESEFLHRTICSNDWRLPYGEARAWTGYWRNSSSWVERKFDSRSWRHQI